MKILALEPYYGGSHKAFLDNLTKNLPFDFKLLTLPARKWKWRMRLSAPYFAEQLKGVDTFDRVLCSTFVDVATLRALGPRWINTTPVLTYFHENQFAYPVQVNDERDLHFALTNITTALASDRLAFNSQYNLDTFINGAGELLDKATDTKLPGCRDAILKKSIVLFPGVDFKPIDTLEKGPTSTRKPTIIWNHRWEHDKNPERFFETLFELAKQGDEFSLVVAGEAFQRQPAIFDEARKRLAGHIEHFGYIRSKEEYIRQLKKADLVVSTADHEFFGISVIEAVRAGCRPLLPKRLSYPELFPAEFLYNEDEFPAKLTAALQKQRLGGKEAISFTEKFSWNNLAEAYKNWLSS